MPFALPLWRSRARSGVAESWLPWRLEADCSTKVERWRVGQRFERQPTMTVSQQVQSNGLLFGWGSPIGRSGSEITLKAQKGLLQANTFNAAYAPLGAARRLPDSSEDPIEEPGRWQLEVVQARCPPGLRQRAQSAAPSSAKHEGGDPPRTPEPGLTGPAAGLPADAVRGSRL